MGYKKKLGIVDGVSSGENSLCFLVILADSLPELLHDGMIRADARRVFPPAGSDMLLSFQLLLNSLNSWARINNKGITILTRTFHTCLPSIMPIRCRFVQFYYCTKGSPRNGYNQRHTFYRFYLFIYLCQQFFVRHLSPLAIDTASAKPSAYVK